MGLFEGRGNLTKGMSELQVRWQETRAEWQDAIAQQFEEKYINSIERDLRSTLAAMDQMGALLSRARSECSEDRE